MKRALPFLVCGLALLFGACAGDDSPIQRVKEQVTGDYPTQTRNFPGQPRAVYAAAKAALKGMGYRITHGGPAEGFLDASSPISPGEEPGTLHQILLHAEFAANLDGKTTDVTLRLSESIADDNQGTLSHGAETPLRDTPLYAVIFRGIGTQLGQP